MFMRKRVALVGLNLLAMGAALYFYQSGILTPEKLFALLAQYPIVAPLIYVAGLATTMILMVPLAMPLNLGAGMLWGIWYGGFLTLLGAGVAVTVSFQLVRHGGGQFAGNFLKSKKAGWIMEAVDDIGWQLVFLARVNPVLPTGLINYLFGLTNVGFWRYFTASMAGLVLPCLLISAIGAFLDGMVITDDLKANLLNGGLVLLLFTLLYALRTIARFKAQKQDNKVTAVSANSPE